VRACPGCGSNRVTADWACEDCGDRPAIVDGFAAFAPEFARDNDGFREEYFAELADLEAQNFWFRARNDLIAWALRTYLPECRSMLEIGCGTGFVLRRIRDVYPDAELVGSEIFSAGLAFAAARVPSAEFIQLDARSIPYRDHFDAIGAFDVLEHIEDDRKVLASVWTALQVGGRFLATVPQHPALWSPQDDHAFHVRRYTAAQLRARLHAAGFEVVRMTSFVSVLLPFMLASRVRMKHRRTGEPFDAMDELRMSPLVNAALGSAMRLEGSLIRRGLSWPAGGSLLVVARKRERAERAA
jgi:SAM-dependent methyltransferase